MFGNHFVHAAKTVNLVDAKAACASGEAPGKRGVIVDADERAICGHR